MYPTFIILNIPYDVSLTFDGGLVTYYFGVLMFYWSKVADEVRPLVVDRVRGIFVKIYEEGI